MTASIRSHEMKTSKSLILFLHSYITRKISLMYAFEDVAISKYNCTQNKKQQQIRLFSPFKVWNAESTYNIQY